jgi:hypothetical protein
MIAISSLRAVEQAQQGKQNNPIIAWNNLAADGTASTTTGTETASAAYLLTGTTYDPWSATPSSGTARVQVDMGAAADVSFVAIAAHNMGSVGATVSVQYSTNGSSWTDCGSGEVEPVDNQAIGFWFTTVSARYWRVVITGASGSVYIGALYVCDPIISPQRIYQTYTPPVTPTSVTLLANRSGNHVLGTAVTNKGSSATATLQHLHRDFVEGEEWIGFQNHFNDGKAFFWAWRPSLNGQLFFAMREGGTIVPSPNVTVYRDATLEMGFYDEP